MNLEYAIRNGELVHISEEYQILLCSGGMRIGSRQELWQDLQRQEKQNEAEV